MSEFVHKSILLQDSIRELQVRTNGVYIDGTLGAGGHSEAILKCLPEGKLIGFDLDDNALAAAGQRLAPFGEHFIPVKSNFKRAKAVLAELGIEKADGVMLDLGVSSPQLDDSDRGFSYSHDAPLDMRMDTTAPFSAYDVVNTYTYADLFRVIRDYGEDHFASRIAQRIVQARENEPIQTTGQLSEIITEAIPAKFRRTGPHPAKRTFQAIRIEVNGELEGLEEAMDMFIDLLAPGGRLCVISFHSLEDRAVKNAMRRAENPCTCPKSAPVCICGKTPLGKMVTRKPILPSEEEQEENPRSRSAKLRVFEKE